MAASYFHVADPVVALMILRLNALEPRELDLFSAFHHKQVAVCEMGGGGEGGRSAGLTLYAAQT